jgi:SSS family solute:Na+ symporter
MAATNAVDGKPNGVFIPERASTGPTPPSAWARRWRCSCTRTRHGDAVAPTPQDDPAQLRHPAGVLLRARPARAARLGRDRRGTKPIGVDGKPNPQLVIPQLFEDSSRAGSPAWPSRRRDRRLVPAAIMSIAAANTFTRNIYKEWIKPHATHAEEAKVSKIASWW